MEGFYWKVDARELLGKVKRGLCSGRDIFSVEEGKQKGFYPADHPASSFYGGQRGPVLQANLLMLHWKIPDWLRLIKFTFLGKFKTAIRSGIKAKCGIGTEQGPSQSGSASGRCVVPGF